MTAFTPYRGDVKIKLVEVEIVLRPSFHAISVLEDHFGKGILEIARDYHNSKINHARDFVAIVEAGIKGAGNNAPENLADQMIVTGLAQMVEPCGIFLAHACGIRG